MSAESVVQAAVLAAVRGVAGLNGVYLGPPVKATVPFAELGDLLSGDWSVKDRAGRELRLIVTVRDAGDSPARAQALAGAVGERGAGAVAVEWRGGRAVERQRRISRAGSGGLTSLSQREREGAA